ncbi:hypothetical protein C922_05491 [Plasmodium inui San Antonio 1]|uniref:Uncharacterized protein n=1 Tax=Plasmodium inui San Antonio 1 TaxID=1237626 RepID=W6ZT86_9APIC|nr:hypothetical protein C922_05491 [Plasmodium inui San Antonio 1]EUD64132.1 hypothetical protein C922_05491 [Plasmodium inui San Antonio 1]
MGSFMHGYMKQHLSGALKEKKCDSAGREQGGICRLRQDRATSLPTGQTTLTEIFKTDQESTLRNVSQMSRTLCVWLESWISTLEGKRTERAEMDFTGQCSYDQFIGGSSKNQSSAACLFERKKLSWIDHRTGSTLSMGQDYQRSLKMCMELITLIMMTAGLTSTVSRRTYKGSTDSGLCQSIYQNLKNWGGEEMAQAIMSDWFSYGDSGKNRKRTFQLPGRDVYEIITEGVLGISSGDKSLTCDISEETPGLEEKIIPEYKTGTSGDTQRDILEGPSVPQEPPVTKMDQLLTQVSTQVKVKDQGRYLLLEENKMELFIKTSVKQLKKDEITVIHFLQGQRLSESNGGQNPQQVSYEGPIVGGVISGLMGILGAYGLYRILGRRRRAKGTRIIPKPPGQVLAYSLSNRQG